MKNSKFTKFNGLVISFISKDFNKEVSFLLDEITDKKVIEMCIKNCIYVLSVALSKYDDYHKELIQTYKDKKDISVLREIRDKTEKELKIGEDKISGVIIWERHIFLSYNEFKKKGIDKYIKDYIK